MEKMMNESTETLVSSAKFAKLVGVSPQSIINFVNQGRLQPTQKMYLGDKDGKPSYKYMFSVSQVESARFISMKGKQNNHILALCLAESQEELDKLGEIAKAELEDELGLERVSTISDYLNDVVESSREMWLESKEYKEGFAEELNAALEKDIEKYLLSEETAVSELYKIFDDMAEIYREKIVVFCYRQFEHVKITEEVEDDFYKSLDKRDIKFIANKYGVNAHIDFIKYNIIFPNFNKKISEDKMRSAKMYFNNVIEKYQEMKNLMADFINCAKSKVWLNYSFISVGALVSAVRLEYASEKAFESYIKQREKNMEDIVKRDSDNLEESESSKKVKETPTISEVLNIVSTYGTQYRYQYKEATYYLGVGCKYMKLKERYTAKFISTKQRDLEATYEIQDNKRVAKDSKIYMLQKVLTTDKENLLSIFIRFVGKEFGKLYVYGFSSLDTVSQALLESMKNTKVYDITFRD